MYYQGFISICVTVAVVGPRRFLFPANAWLRNFKTSKITTRDVLYKLLRIVMFIGVNWLLYRRIGPSSFITNKMEHFSFKVGVLYGWKKAKYVASYSQRRLSAVYIAAKDVLPILHY